MCLRVCMCVYSLRQTGRRTHILLKDLRRALQIERSTSCPRVHDVPAIVVCGLALWTHPSAHFNHSTSVPFLRYSNSTDPRYRNKTVNPWENRTGNGRSLIGARGSALPISTAVCPRKGRKGSFSTTTKNRQYLPPISHLPTPEHMLRPVLEVDLPRGSQSLRPELIKPRMPVVVLGWLLLFFHSIGWCCFLHCLALCAEPFKPNQRAHRRSGKAGTYSIHLPKLGTQPAPATKNHPTRTQPSTSTNHTNPNTKATHKGSVTNDRKNQTLDTGSRPT